jgi:ABC-type spermidine/putrescine transport system permease subunit II
VLLVILPLASNFLIRIYAWIIVLGPADLLYTPFAVIAGMVYVHLPFMILPLYTNLEQHDPALLEAAQDLGAGTWTRFWRITLPLSLPGIWAGSALVFIPVLGMFAIPELLGGTRDLLIGNLIKEQFLDNRDWPLGSTLSMLLTAAVLAAGRAVGLGRRGRAGGAPDGAASPVALAVGCGPGRLRLSLPAAGGGRDLLVQRFAAQCRVGRLHHPLVWHALRRYRDAARRRQLAVHRLTAATMATVLGTMAGIAMQRWRVGFLRGLPFLVLTPVAMPEILLGVSLLLFFRQVLDLTLGLISILIAHITFSIGFVAIIVRVRLAGPGREHFRSGPRSRRQPWQTFRRVTLPLDPAGHPGRFPDELHALDRRLRDHLLCRRRWRHDAAAADLLDDQGGGESRSQCRVDAADGADADLIALASKLAPDTLQGRA